MNNGETFFVRGKQLTQINKEKTILIYDVIKIKIFSTFVNFCTNFKHFFPYLKSDAFLKKDDEAINFML
jgi:hypothetical protein